MCHVIQRFFSPFKIGILFILAALLFAGCGADVRPERAVFVLAGQSNMAGTARSEGPLPDERVRLFGLDRRMRLAREPLQDPAGAVDTVFVRDGIGVGPGLYFAKKLLRLNPQAEITLVPCAKGATSIREWGKGSLLAMGLVDRAKEAVSRTRSPDVSAILFWQGETDGTRSPTYALAWGGCFEEFVETIRKELGPVPIFLARIQSRPGEISREIVRRQQAEAARMIPGVFLVDLDDIPSVGDHHRRSGYRKAGERFARAYYAYERGLNRR